MTRDKALAMGRSRDDRDTHKHSCRRRTGTHTITDAAKDTPPTKQSLTSALRWLYQRFELERVSNDLSPDVARSPSIGVRSK